MRSAQPERDVLRGPMRTVSNACTVYDEIESGTDLVRVRVRLRVRIT